MAMRMTGLMSGMDTESVIAELVAARSAKVKTAKNDQTRLEWKQDIWKGLNTKLKALHSKLSDLRFSSGYTKKTTRVSDSSIVSVLTGESAMDGVQELEVRQLAKTAYLTGGKVTTKDERVDLKNIKLSELSDAGIAADETKQMTVKVGDGAEKTVEVSGDMTVDELIQKLDEAGLKAAYDVDTNQILYSAREKGESVQLGNGLSSMQYGEKKEISDDLTALTELGDLMTFAKDADGKAIPKTIKLTTEDGRDIDIRLTSETTISDMLTEMKNAGLNANFDAGQRRFFISAKDTGKDGNFEISGDEDALKALGLNVSGTADADGVTDGATYIKGQNARIILNGVVFENNTNVFEVNGLTFTALSETEPGKSVTVTTQQDTDGIYDMIKDFLKAYNEVINEMDKLYNADSARGYEPLSDEEKESMSESEIEKYEQKIKDSLLRRDSNLSSLSFDMKKVMLSGASVNGKQMYLSNFGIETLSYFLAEDNERNAYHINGDPDDTDTSKNEDKLRKLITTDPDTVISFFSQLSQELYTKMSEHSKAIEGYRSFGNFYDDKKMKTDYTDYTSKIKDLEKKLADYEDKWYAKFAAMETAMAKMQSSASAVTGLLGGS